jgi:AraC-like DNA-binding protein
MTANLSDTLAAAFLLAGTLQLAWLAVFLGASPRYRQARRPVTLFLSIALAALVLRMGKSSLNAFLETGSLLRNLGLAGMIAVPPALFGHWIALARARISAVAVGGLAVAVIFAVFAGIIPNVPDDPISRGIYAAILCWGGFFAAAGVRMSAKPDPVGRWIRASAWILAGLWGGFLLVFLAGSRELYAAWCALFAAGATALTGAWFIEQRLSTAYARLLRLGTEPAGETARARELLAALADERFRDPDLNLQRFSRQVGIPARHVSDLLTGLPPHHFRAHLNHIRVEAAKAELRSGWQHSLTDLAMHVGYNSSAAFSRAFKAQTGTAPSDWRARISTENGPTETGL